jgi:mannose-6-phosphate isomerase-like protein (cupin superfamily)
MGRGDGELEIVEKPWGKETWWALTEHYVGKIIEIKAGNALSLQYHQEKTETMLFYSGSGRLVLGKETQPIKTGTSVTILPGTLHRVIADTDIIIFEVSTPQVNDVVRVSDEYDREKEVE